MLPNENRREPSLPLILAAWSETSDEAKQERLELYLRWADQHGVLGDAASSFALCQKPNGTTTESSILNFAQARQPMVCFTPKADMFGLEIM